MLVYGLTTKEDTTASKLCMAKVVGALRFQSFAMQLACIAEPIVSECSNRHFRVYSTMTPSPLSKTKNGCPKEHPHTRITKCATRSRLAEVCPTEQQDSPEFAFICFLWRAGVPLIRTCQMFYSVWLDGAEVWLPLCILPLLQLVNCILWLQVQSTPCWPKK